MKLTITGKKRPIANPLPTEEWEQEALLNWATRLKGQAPELSLIFHIPNSGNRHISYARKQQRLGLKAGVPDLFLPVARGGFHGLFIELKRQRGGTVSQKQEDWIGRLQVEGYRVEVCKGWQRAAKILCEYLGIILYRRHGISGEEE